MQTIKEKGAASILIELVDGNIIVKHGTDGAVLLEILNAPTGAWDKIWQTLEAIKTN